MARDHKWLVAPLCVAALILCLGLLLSFWLRAGRQGLPERRATWTEYTWEELATVADALSACASDEEAISLASRYGLCTADGRLDPALSKDVSLLTGTVAQARLVGIWHDGRSDGGKAGLTFALCGVGEGMRMNLSFDDPEGDHAQSVGGWAASDGRAWLADTLWYELPLDLRSGVASVQKLTANAVDANDELAEAGRLAGSGSDWVSETSDRLWLFSAAELCGGVPASEDLGVDETMCGVYDSEGSQYQLFSESGVKAFESSELLASFGYGGDEEAQTWWLRTKTLEFGDGFWLVGTDGTTLNGLGEDARVVEDPEFSPDELWGPDHERTVVVGFCL